MALSYVTKIIDAASDLARYAGVRVGGVDRNLYVMRDSGAEKQSVMLSIRPVVDNEADRNLYEISIGETTTKLLGKRTRTHFTTIVIDQAGWDHLKSVEPLSK